MNDELRWSNEKDYVLGQIRCVDGKCDDAMAFHQREHELIEKALNEYKYAVDIRMKGVEVDVDRARISRTELLSTDTYNRAHETLETRLALAEDKIRADVRVELEKMSGTLATLKASTASVNRIALVAVLGLVATLVAVIVDIVVHST